MPRPVSPSWPRSAGAFLTPIGHQNNTLILGPGGYAYGDYWRMGLPRAVIAIAVGVPAILLAWPVWTGLSPSGSAPVPPSPHR